jgi:hypothetical protein
MLILDFVKQHQQQRPQCIVHKLYFLCIFSETFDVKHIDNPSNLAFTNRGLASHSDLSYLNCTPDVSLSYFVSKVVIYIKTLKKTPESLQ